MMYILKLSSCGYEKMIIHIYASTYHNQFTYKWLSLKVSNAISTLKCFLNVCDIDGIKHLLQMIHGLLQNWDVETHLNFS